MPRKPLIIGEWIHHTPEGDIVEPMALVIQRRWSKRSCPTHGGKYMYLIVECPICGERHEHGDGNGSRVPNCTNKHGFQGEYWLGGADQPAVPANTPYPKPRPKPQLRVVK